MVVVSTATRHDAHDVADLMQEMDVFYGEQRRESSASKVDGINSILFGDQPCASALLAWHDSLLVGFASYSFLWPAVMSEKSLYLKGIYVRQGHRQSGVGRLLMARLSELALEQRCSSIEWTTDQDNQDAQNFYERLGASRNPTKLFYHVTGDAVRMIAASMGQR